MLKKGFGWDIELGKGATLLVEDFCSFFSASSILLMLSDFSSRSLFCSSSSLIDNMICVCRSLLVTKLFSWMGALALKD